MKTSRLEMLNRKSSVAMMKAATWNSPAVARLLSADRRDETWLNVLRVPEVKFDLGEEDDSETPRAFTAIRDRDALCGYFFFADIRMNKQQRVYGACSKWCPRTAFCAYVQVKAEAGFVRDWCMRWDGQHTHLAVRKVVGWEPATEIDGVVVPIDSEYEEFLEADHFYQTHVDPYWEKVEIPQEHIVNKSQWGIPLDVPVYIFCPKERSAPSVDFPILQTQVDCILKGALEISRDVAAKLLCQTKGWSVWWENDRVGHRQPWISEPLAPQIDFLLWDCPGLSALNLWPRDPGEYGAMAYAYRAGPNTVQPVGFRPSSRPYACGKHGCSSGGDGGSRGENCAAFIFGFGSLLNSHSRMRDAPSATCAVAVRITKGFGYRREWNFKSHAFSALGLAKADPPDTAESINGVAFPVTAFELEQLRERERGYDEVEIPCEMVEYIVSWQRPKVNVPFRVFVPTPQLCACADVEHPILQSYIDVCVNGCLEHGEEFAKEFIVTCGEWPEFWLNDRLQSCRPWLHEPNWRKIDALLADALESSFGRRMPEHLYAAAVQGAEPWASADSAVL